MVGKISALEGICLMSFFIAAKVFFALIGISIRHTATASWYITLASMLLSMLFFLFLCKLLKRFPGKNIVEIFKIVFGRFLGSVLALLFSVYALYNAGIILREFIEMIKAYNLPYTPPSIIMILFIALLLFYLRIGLQSLAQVATLCFFPVLVGTAMILILAIPNYDPNNLAPFGGNNLWDNLYYSLFRTSGYSEIFFLATIYPSFQNYKTFRRVGLFALLIGGFVFSLNILFSLMAFGYEMSSEYISSLFQLSRLIYFNRFFQRLESIFLFIWVISSFLNVSISTFFALHIYTQVFRIENPRPFIPSLLFLTMWIAFLPKNLFEIIFVHLVVLHEFSILFIFSIPLITLIVSLFRHQGLAYPRR